MRDEKLHDDIKLIRMREREARLAEHILQLCKRQLQSDGKGDDRRLGRLIALIRADLRKEFAVDVRLFVALRVRHAALVDLAQEHLGKALVELLECVFERAWVLHSDGARRRRCIRLHAHGCAADRIRLHAALTCTALIRMRRGIAVVNICRDVCKQLAADLIRLAVKDDEVDGHIVRKQEIADGIDRRPERQILRKSVDTGGDERKRDRRTAVLQRERKRRPVAGSE